MSHNTLIEKINADVAAEVAKIKEAGQTEIVAVERETEKQLETIRSVHKAALEKKLAQRELVAVSKAKQTSKIALQTAKREEIDGLFTEVASELSGAALPEYVQLFSKYAADIIPPSVDVVSVQAPEERLNETIEILKARGLSGEVTVAPRIAAGFVLYAKDGVYDVTLDRIMSEVRAGLEMEVVKKVMM